MSRVVAGLVLLLVLIAVALVIIELFQWSPLLGIAGLTLFAIFAINVLSQTDEQARAVVVVLMMIAIVVAIIVVAMS